MSPTVRSHDGTTIAYTREGRGQPLILVDGALCHRGHGPMPRLAQALASGFTTYSYDRRGRGESGDTRPYAVEREIEDVAALVEQAGLPVFLYGFSSGAILALRAAARLGTRISRLVVHEPPFNSDDEDAKRSMHAFAGETARLLATDRKADAVSFFLKDMVPPPVLEQMKQSPPWTLMVAMAPTLSYDNAVLGDGAVPRAVAAAVRAPTLVLDGSESAGFKHVAADALAAALPNARRQTVAGHHTLIPPEVLAPVLQEFFASHPAAPQPPSIAGF